MSSLYLKNNIKPVFEREAYLVFGKPIFISFILIFILRIFFPLWKIKVEQKIDVSEDVKDVSLLIRRCNIAKKAQNTQNTKTKTKKPTPELLSEQF